MFIVARKYFVQAPLGATSANSGCRPAGAKNSTQPYCYKHFAPPGQAPQNPLAPGFFYALFAAVRCGASIRILVCRAYRTDGKNKVWSVNMGDRVIGVL